MEIKYSEKMENTAKNVIKKDMIKKAKIDIGNTNIIINSDRETITKVVKLLVDIDEKKRAYWGSRL